MRRVCNPEFIQINLRKSKWRDVVPGIRYRGGDADGTALGVGWRGFLPAGGRWRASMSEYATRGSEKSR